MNAHRPPTRKELRDRATKAEAEAAKLRRQLAEKTGEAKSARSSLRKEVAAEVATETAPPSAILAQAEAITDPQESYEFHTKHSREIKAALRKQGAAKGTPNYK